MKLLIIRPEPGASASAARAQEAGFEPILLPLFEVRPREWPIPESTDFDALLLTSGNAIRHAGENLDHFRQLPAYCVGQNTAIAARQAGLSIAQTGAGDAADIIALAASAGRKKLLWLTGEDHRKPDVPPGVTIETVIVYASEALPLPANAALLISAVDAIALHSPRAAMALAEAVDSVGLPRQKIVLATFSPAIAAAAGDGWQDIIVADHPRDSALLPALLSALTAHTTYTETVRETG
jgi:uroporphyrinogen-III synthase